MTTVHVASRAMSADRQRPESGSDEIEARLDELQRASEQRRRELAEIAAALPAATSRRAYLAAMVRGAADVPDKPQVAGRVVRKIVRTPADLLRSRRR